MFSALITRTCTLLFFVLIGLSLSGCSGDLDLSSEGATTLYLQGDPIRGMDPAMATDVASSKAIGKVYEGLLQYNYLARPYRLMPNLAESMPEISEDGLTYTFTIRKGIMFTDDPCFEATDGKGREITAADFVFSFKRIADRKVVSPGYWIFNNRIKGLDEFRDLSSDEGPTDYSLNVEGLQAPDSHTLVINLSKAYPQLMSVLAMSYCYVVSPEAVNYYGKNFANHSVGTGPYELTHWQRNYRLEFNVNPSWVDGRRQEYFRDKDDSADEGRVLPMTPRIVQYVINDPNTKWMMFLQGQIHLVPISNDNWDAVMTESFTLQQQMKEQGIRMQSAPTMRTSYIGFNMDDPIVGKNKKLRLAMAAAFDSESWETYYKGRVVRARGILPPGVAGYQDKSALVPFNLDEAKRLLAEAGYPEGVDTDTGKQLELTMDIGRTDTATRESSELFQSFMAEIGVRLKLSYNTWPAFLGKTEKRQVQLFRLGWTIDYPDAENFLQLFYSPNASPGPNRTNYSNPNYDKLYETVRVMQDSPERTRLYERMADILAEDGPWLFVDHPMAFDPYHETLHNYVPHDFPYGMDKNWRVGEPDKR